MTSTSFPKPCRGSRSATTGSLMHPKAQSTQVGGAKQLTRGAGAQESLFCGLHYHRAPLMSVLARPDGHLPKRLRGPSSRFALAALPFNVSTRFIAPNFTSFRTSYASLVGVTLVLPSRRLLFLIIPHINNARMTPSPAHIGLALALVPAGRPGQSS